MMEIGDRVRSKRVGSREAFEGVVVHKAHVPRGDFRGWYFHVRDEAGNEWHRRPSELEPVAALEAAA